MTAPTPNGQSPDAVREAVSRTIREHFDVRRVVSGFEEAADAIIAEYITPLLAQRDAAMREYAACLHEMQRSQAEEDLLCDKLEAVEAQRDAAIARAEAAERIK